MTLSTGLPRLWIFIPELLGFMTLSRRLHIFMAALGRLKIILLIFGAAEANITNP